MANGKRILRLTAIAITLAGVLGFQLEAMGMLGSTDETAGRPDVIMIDTIARLESLEQPAAVFKHDAHTKALKDQGMSCESCHQKDAKGDLTLTFGRQEDESGAEPTASGLKDMYHDNCISCHVKSEEKGFKTGPKAGECRGCHQVRPETADRVPAGMDNMLHFVHWDSKIIPADQGKETNCGACHKKAGEEDSWRFSDQAKTEPLKDVFHSQCVTCHQSLIEKKAERSGPVQCAGCHGAGEIATRNVELAKDLKAMGGTLPRLPRKQPDAVLMAPGAKDKEAEAKAGDKPSGMAPVAFDHKLHEAKSDSCMTCHKDGVNAKLNASFEALHNVNDPATCVGCHVQEQKKPECAGCHEARPAAKALSENSCVTCHNVDVTAEPGFRLMASAPVNPAAMSKEEKEAMAAKVIAARPETQAMVAEKDIPEFVNIEALADQYQPSKMPHRKIVLTLMKGMKDNRLAATFHTSPEAVCAGCHHNAPATLTPPKCASCHGKPFETEGRPGLKAAYHGQCMSCHQEMKLEKPAATNCVACHEKKTN
ncbi:cytochrome c3 family protein [Pseudodesulfovibrio thermohalotolerans]|uniref:sulfate respiration complex hexadecaheme cytochrome HmcA n=1 Tax=Pseudodesulfovibrio thermohalotolerans TaxID=2880651 RepID=UPI0024413D99|nr:cytochrome c3 family protein [Pseudodesulfovibrio thermohalotolerans]WFS61892.1 cytochrome c3 family protein [Pseudodesulfovibrio thermohalotolerans]